MRMILQKAVKSVAKMVYTIDCTAPAEDKIFDVIAFVCLTLCIPSLFVFYATVTVMKPQRTAGAIPAPAHQGERACWCARQGGERAP